MSQKSIPTGLAIKKGFSDENREKLRVSDQKQKHFHETISRAGRFTDDQKLALSLRSKEDFQLYWSSAHNAGVSYNVKREQGAGRLSKGATSFAASAHDLLENFNPILDLVKDCGAPYGGIAIGTICFVFVAAKNRVRMEEQILAIFSFISDRLPGIRMYQRIHNADHELDRALQVKIVDAYHSFIEFCMEAFEFYTKGGFRRWLQALQTQTDLDEQGQRVRDAIQAVRLVCEELLSKNVDTMMKNIEDSKSKIDQLVTANRRLEGQVADLQESKDSSNLEKICELLGVQSFSKDEQRTDLDDNQRYVANEFRQGNPYSKITLEERQQAIESDEVYREWLNGSHSSVLVLSGQNNYYRSPFCWVSPVAFRMVEKHLRDLDSGFPSPDPFAFYLLGLRKEANTWADVLSFLICRLLHLNKKALRDEEQNRELRAEVKHYEELKNRVPDNDRKADRMLKQLNMVALRVLNLFSSSQPIWIVVDRLDKCELMPGQREPHNGKGGPSLLRAMVHLAERSSVKIKMLAVVNRADWPIESQADDFGGTRDGSLLIRTFRQSGERHYGDR